MPSRRDLEDARRRARETNQRSCETKISVPSYFSRPSTSASIASRSRWLVGSSSTSTLGFSTASRANTSRAASPPERVPTRFLHVVAGEEHSAELAAHEADRLARAEVPQPAPRPSAPRLAQLLAVVLREVAGVASRSPTRPCRRRPRRRPSTILSSVDLPMPLGPMIARRSPRRTWSATSSSTWSLAVGLRDALGLEHVLPARAHAGANLKVG